MPPDTELGDALRALPRDATRAPQWEPLRRAIAERAAPELARRRWRRRTVLALPAALAASIALVLLLPPALDVAGTGDRAAGLPGSAAQSAALDDLLDADVSDRQFRALLFGAKDADDLLLIAAAEGLP
jgi:hypothetical protein